MVVKFCVLCTFTLWIDLFVHCCRSSSWWPSPIPPRQHETWCDSLPPNTNSAPRNKGPERYGTRSVWYWEKAVVHLAEHNGATNKFNLYTETFNILNLTFYNYMKVYLHTFTCIDTASWQDLFEWIRTQHCIVTSRIYSITWHNLQYS